MQYRTTFFVKFFEIERNSDVNEVRKMDGKVIEKVKEMTLRQLMVNITNDCQEDADTGFSWELTIEEYIKNLFDI